MIKEMKHLEIITTYENIERIKKYVKEKELGILEDDAYLVVWFFKEEIKEKEGLLKLIDEDHNDINIDDIIFFVFYTE